MRRFIRHPSDIPLDFQLSDMESDTYKRMKNYSEGGLCFVTGQWVEPDSDIRISIPSSASVFEANVTVVWCKPIQDGFEVGVRFADQAAEDAMQMVERLAQIEAYRREQERQGRFLESEEAAKEWNRRFASDFSDT
jgi:hypothetical protein